MRLGLDSDLRLSSIRNLRCKWLGGISNYGGTRMRLKLENMFTIPRVFSQLPSPPKMTLLRPGKLSFFRLNFELIYRSRLHWFNTLGIFIGRALLDSRIIDLNLNKVLLQLILGVPIKKNIATLRLIDEQLARSLERLQSYLNARKEIEALPLGPEARNNKLGSLTVGGAQLGDLSLDFTVPGHGIELKVC